LDEINPGVHIRLIFKGGYKFALVDFIMAVTGQVRVNATMMITNAIKSEQNATKANRLLHERHKFPGRGQQDIWIVNIDEAIEFLDCLPDKHTDDVKRYIRNQFFRVMGGDPSLHEEINRNAQSNGVVQQAAREIVGLPVTNRNVLTEYDVEDRAFKKRRETLEMDKEEMALKERPARFALEMAKQQADLAKQQADLAKQQADLTEQRVQSASRMMVVHENFEGADRQWMQQIAKTELNAMLKHGNVDAPEQTTITREAGLFNQPRDPKTLARVGAIASNLYLDLHGQRPPKRAGGNARYDECIYTTKDRAIIAKAFAEDGRHVREAKDMQGTIQFKSVSGP
jgi:hypothetical protein